MSDLFHQPKELIFDMLTEMLMWGQPPSAVRLDWTWWDWSKPNPPFPKVSPGDHLSL